jgi:hypothetical protein
MVEYDISIIDTNSGDEVLTMNGEGEDTQVAKLMIKAIRSHSR